MTYFIFIMVGYGVAINSVTSENLSMMEKVYRAYAHTYNTRTLRHFSYVPPFSVVNELQSITIDRPKKETVKK